MIGWEGISLISLFFNLQLVCSSNAAVCARSEGEFSTDSQNCFCWSISFLGKKYWKLEAKNLCRVRRTTHASNTYPWMKGLSLLYLVLEITFILIFSHFPFPNIQITQPRRIWRGQTKKYPAYQKGITTWYWQKFLNIEETQILLASVIPDTNRINICNKATKGNRQGKKGPGELQWMLDTSWISDNAAKSCTKNKLHLLIIKPINYSLRKKSRNDNARAPAGRVFWTIWRSRVPNWHIRKTTPTVQDSTSTAVVKRCYEPPC